MTAIETIKIGKITSWPNGLGFTATVNRIKFDITNDRRIGRLWAWRVIGDELCEECEIVNGGEWVEGDENVVKLVYRVWRDKRELWTE